MKSSSTNFQTGYEDDAIIAYSPIKYQNFEVLFNFSKNKSWGYGFNEIDSSLLLQNSNETLSISIIPRDDETYLSSLNLSITLPINNSEHLERIIFTGEGYYKKSLIGSTTTIPS